MTDIYEAEMGKWECGSSCTCGFTNFWGHVSCISLRSDDLPHAHTAVDRPRQTDRLETKRARRKFTCE